MRAVHQAQDLAFHLKAAEKNKTACFKKEDQLRQLQHQLSFWQHMNTVQNEKIAGQLETIAKGRSELAGLNEQIFEMQERLVKIRVKFGVGNKEHKAPSTLNTKNIMGRAGRISASAEPAINYGSDKNVCDESLNVNNMLGTRKNVDNDDNFLHENIITWNQKNLIATKRCWQENAQAKPPLHDTDMFSSTTFKEQSDLDINILNRGKEIGDIESTKSVDNRLITKDTLKVTKDRSSQTIQTSKGISAEKAKDVKVAEGLEKEQMSSSTRNVSTNIGETSGEDDSFIKLLSEDDDPVNTDEDSDVMTVPPEAQNPEMIRQIPAIIKNSSRTADIRKSGSLSPPNDDSSSDLRNARTSSIEENGVCDIKINVEVDDTKRSEKKEAIDDPDQSASNSEVNGTVKKDSRKRVSFEHSSMLRSACIEGNLELVKSLDFSGGSRDIDGKL